VIISTNRGINRKFITTGIGNSNAASMCCAPNGNIYLGTQPTFSIYMQTGESGAFNSLGQTGRTWYGMCAAPNGDVYAGVLNGSIYMQTNGTGNFVTLSQTSRVWRGMCAAPNGNIYACVDGGDIYMQTNGSGTFNALLQTPRNWTSMAAAPNGDIYAKTDGIGAGIYVRFEGIGNFLSLLGFTIYAGSAMCASPAGNVYYLGGAVVYKMTSPSPNYP